MNIRHDKRFLKLVSLGSVVLAVTVPAYAQEAGDLALEEIVVTAQKRTERLQDIPVSINVVNDEQLANSGVRQFEDLTKLAPSLSVTSATGGLHSTISMRGIYTNALSPGVPTGVGIVVDDVAQPTEARGFGELADIERIEVLRGPQSTVSGRNAAAGLINIVTKAPSNTFGANVEAVATNDQEYRLKGYVTGPLSDAVSASLTAYWNDWDGLIKNVVTNKKLGRDSWGIRPKLRFAPTENFDATLTVYHQELNENSGGPVFQYFEPGAAFQGSPPSVAVANVPFNGSNKTSTSIVSDLGQRSESDGGSLRMNIGLGEHSLVSITGYQKEHVDAVQDIYGTRIPRATVPTNAQLSTVDTKTLSQEVRLVSPATGALTYVAGVYYLATQVDYDFSRVATIAGLNFNRLRSPESKNYAAYLRGTGHLSERFDVTAGVRYNREDISYSLFDRLSNISQSADDSDAVVLGDVSLQYKFLPDVMGYVRYARGHQGRVYDLDSPLLPTTYVPLEAEEVDSYEVGLKSQFLDRRVTLNLAVFDAVYKNYQAQRINAQATALTFQLLNVGEVETRGLELDAEALVTDNFKTDFTLAYVDAVINEFPGAPCYRGQTAAQGCVGSVQNLADKTLAGTPDWRGRIGAQYRLPVEVGAFTVSLRGEVFAQSKVNFDILGNPLTKQDAYSIVNLSTILARSDDRYQASIFINNLFDKAYVRDLTDSGGFWGGLGAIQTRDLPRDFERYGGVRFSAKF